MSTSLSITVDIRHLSVRRLAATASDPQTRAGLNETMGLSIRALALRDPSSRTLQPLHLLERRVTQKQDRSLLPSIKELGRAAGETAPRWRQPKINTADS